jgi:5'-deoxynucleotidase
MLPEDFRTDFSDIYNPPKEVKALVKAADKISALIKCVEEINMGNREFLAAEKSVRKAVEKIDLPEVKIFMKEFMPAFSLSLDEQA